MVKTKSEREPTDEQQTVANTGEQISEAQPMYGMPVSSEQLKPDAQESSVAVDVGSNITESTQDEINHIEPPPPPVSQTEIAV